MATVANDNEVKDAALILLMNETSLCEHFRVANVVAISFKVCLCACAHILGKVGSAETEK